MPRIKYSCSSCGKSFKRFFTSAKKITDIVDCKLCQAKGAIRQLSAPSSKSTMTIDNGAQARATEIIHDIVELNRDKSVKGGNRGD